jgi:hypothetical protein
MGMAQASVKTGRAYAFLQSRCDLGLLRRELAVMKERAKIEDAVEIQAHRSDNVPSIKERKGIPAAIVARAIAAEANYVVKAEWAGNTNEYTAYALDAVLNARSDVMRPGQPRVYYGEGRSFHLC